MEVLTGNIEDKDEYIGTHTLAGSRQRQARSPSKDVAARRFSLANVHRVTIVLMFMVAAAGPWLLERVLYN